MNRTIKYCIICALFLTGSITRPLDQTIWSKHINLNQVHKLMIVAHPDDETIWGGMHLSEGDFLVVCLTHKEDPIRSKEFMDVIKKTKNQGLIFDYPDKTQGKRNNWKDCKTSIYQDLYTIIRWKSFDQIVTHNPKGEYGHIHHKMTSQLVIRACPDRSKVYYFGKYYRKGQVPDTIKPIKGKKLSIKKELIDLYPSQNKVMNTLAHIFPYEDWIPYKEWR